MKFKLRTTKDYYYPDKHGNKNYIEKLKSIGFKFEIYEYIGKKCLKIKDIEEIELDLEELVNLTKEFGEIIIENNTLEIYNSYRE
jgi:hypothetical protein